jgi:hypothetical protein
VQQRNFGLARHGEAWKAVQYGSHVDNEDVSGAWRENAGKHLQKVTEHRTLQSYCETQAANTNRSGPKGVPAPALSSILTRRIMALVGKPCPSIGELFSLLT